MIPRPEQWPPTKPGFERDAPRPEPPIDPNTGKPKGGDAAQASSSRAEASNSLDLGERPCGAVVEKIRTDTVEGGGWLCYLEDGRYAAALRVDAIEPIDSQEKRDNLCRINGFARSVQ